MAAGTPTAAAAAAMTAARTNDHAQRARRDLAERLGEQLPADWRDAYNTYPRHLFVPDRVWVRLEESLDRSTDPDRWLAYAYGDDSMITQLHDGAESSEHGYPISSSCSMPAVVFTMLGHLDPQPGERILEIGTGTGWTAALLAHQLGEGQVVSVEVDPALAQTARRNLLKAGCRPPEWFQEDVTARMPTPEERDRLDLAAGTPVLGIRRTVWGPTGRSLEINVMTADAGSYVLRYRWVATQPEVQHPTE